MGWGGVGNQLNIRPAPWLLRGRGWGQGCKKLYYAPLSTARKHVRRPVVARKPQIEIFFVSHATATGAVRSACFSLSNSCMRLNMAHFALKVVCSEKSGGNFSQGFWAGKWRNL